MTKEEAKELAFNELKKFPELYGWKFNFHKKKRSLGTCIQSKKTIYLSEELLPYLKDNTIKMTILHEIAHALTPNCGHNERWRRKCIEIGGDGKRLAERNDFNVDYKEGYLKETSKYTLKCPTCGNEVYYNRLTDKLKNCACSKCCQGIFNSKHKFEIIQNY